MRNFERNAAVGPDLPNHSADGFLRSDIGWVIFAAVDDCNSRLSVHEPIEDLFADGGDTGRSQRFVDDGSNYRHRLSATDQRITKFIGVHSHKVGAIYNNCTCGSMLNVQLHPHFCRLRDSRNSSDN